MYNNALSNWFRTWCKHLLLTASCVTSFIIFMHQDLSQDSLCIWWIGCVGQGGIQGTSFSVKRKFPVELEALVHVVLMHSHLSCTHSHTDTHKTLHCPEVGWSEAERKDPADRVVEVHSDTYACMNAHTRTHTHTHTQTHTYMVGHFKDIPQHAQHCRKIPMCTSVKSAWESKWATDKCSHKWRAALLALILELHMFFQQQRWQKNYLTTLLE